MRRAAQRNELDAVEHRRLVRRTDRETDAARRLRDSTCDTCGSTESSSRSGCPAGAVPPPPRRAGRPLRLEQQVHVEAIAAVGRNAPGRGVRLLNVTLFLEPGEDVAHRRRRHAQARGGTSIDEATGSPEVMYSRTSAARTRRERSWVSCH